MQRLSLLCPAQSLITSCTRQRLTTTISRIRLRHDTAQASRAHNSTRHQRWLPGLRPKPSFSSINQLTANGRGNIHQEDVIDLFESSVRRWSRKPELHRRLVDFGVPSWQVEPLLTEFVNAARSGELSSPANQAKYDLTRFAYTPNELNLEAYRDRVFTNIFFVWASDPETRPFIERIVPVSTVQLIQRLVTAVDSSYPADQFTQARRMRRKVIMHVGPTNSGKTHNALRALAAARVGLYAGPLRLLAHEIFERLNSGQIMPLCVTDTEQDAGVEEENSPMDLGDGIQAARKIGNPRYARPCNLVTGEEQKIVDEDAPLTSSTVEMVTFSKVYDVAVVDEIQMLADENRGGGWTNAVLGLAAKELHLCGEETAVPLVEAMLKETGDELIVNRYKRLTPLSIERESLCGDLSRIRRGDCVVTFSRNGIFGLKNRIEELTGMRCAVVYGKLPPEIRNAQAALFNDPNSDYDVIIGSDAIGMGLNLKIKRIVFETVHKFDGKQQRFLSLSQTKQIAGRAGRYGLHGDNSPGGTVTTLLKSDMPFLRKALVAPPQPLLYARLNPSYESFTAVSQILPPGSSTQIISDAHAFCSKRQPIYLYVEYPRMQLMSQFISDYGSNLTVSDKIMLSMAPIPWRDEDSLEVFKMFMSMFHERLSVNVLEVLSQTDWMSSLEVIEEMMDQDLPPKATPQGLNELESMHKMLVLYMWLSLRNPVAYHTYDEAVALKERVEKALDWSLSGISRVDKWRSHKYIRQRRSREDIMPFHSEPSPLAMSLDP